MTVSEKVAYLRGLAGGMGLDENENSTKLFNAMIDVLDEIASELSDIEEDCEDLNDYIEEVDEALGDVEEFVYDDCCDCDCDCDDDCDCKEGECHCGHRH